MAEVLEARAMGEAGFERRVALKRMLPAAAADESHGRMFVDEARIASRLHHSNIVSILDFGIVDGAPFQVLEFIDGADGRSLVRRSAEGKLPVAVGLHLCAQVGHALSYAHGARGEGGGALGIVHRDVTPGNVLVSWEGDVKLADFGIALSENRTEVTEYGMTKGTPSYMSPEQALGVTVDPRADVFSLGCVLHMLLTGKSPLADGAHLDFYTKHVLALAPGLPEDVRAIIRQATFFDRADRFRSAAAMTEALGQALASRTSRDPRMELKSFLEDIRPAKQAPVGSLDHLFDVEIVFEDEVDGTRRFSLLPASRTVTSPLHAAGAPSAAPLVDAHPGAPIPAPSDADKEPDTAALAHAAGLARTTPRWPFAAAGAVLVALVSVAAISRLGGTATGARMLQTSTPSTDAPTSVTHSPLAPLLPLEPSAASSAVVHAASPPSARSSHASSPSSAAPARSVPPAAVVTPTTAEDCRGTIYVNCTAATRARVLLDGDARQQHSGERITNVTCGSHTVTFLDDAKGKRAVSVSVERGQLASAACGFPSD